MNRTIILIVISLLLPLRCLTQNHSTYTDRDATLIGRNIHVLPIGIRDYQNRNLSPLLSANIMNDYDSIKSIFSSDNFDLITPVVGNVTAEEVNCKISELAGKAKSNDIIIIHIIGHGKVENGNYSLVCSDRDLPGKDILRNLEYMTKKGALVIFFLNTCYSGALLADSNSSLIKGEGAIAFFASSNRNETSPEKDQDAELSKYVIESLKRIHPGAFAKSSHLLTLGTLKTFLEKNVVNPQPYIRFITKGSSETYNGQNIYAFPIIKESDVFVHEPLKPAKAFLPWAVSPNKGKGLDGVLIGVEFASLIGMVVCGPVLQSHYQNKIDNTTNPWERNDYRKKGKNAAIGFCVSTGLLVSSYLGRALHVRHQISLKNLENQRGGSQSVTLDVMPTFSPDNNGLSLVLNF